MLKKTALWTLSILLTLYIGVCAFYYFAQSRMLFPTIPLSPGYQYAFNGRYEERRIVVADGKKLDGLLFKTDSAKGLIFYLHGNGGNLSSWGEYAHYFTDLHYDIFFIDYRGYGKSEGHLSGESQLMSDLQIAYDDLRKTYPEKDIVILGYSIGTGPAAILAARNHPRMLILQAPYYSMKALSVQYIPWISGTFPSFLMKFPLNTYQYIPQIKAPIAIFHGNRDSVIYIAQSEQLRPYLKPGDKYVVLDGQGHNRFMENEVYLRDLREILQ